MITFRQLLEEIPDATSRHLLRQFNLAQRSTGRAQSVRDLALSLGFDVTEKSFPLGIDGRLVADPFASNGYEIQVNKHHSVERRRWTLMHEIAHFFLHRNHEDFFAENSYRASPGFHFYRSDELVEEKQANEFVAAAFFGDGALAAINSWFQGDVKKISRAFGLSEKAIRIALKEKH
ncbi:hypothetical protein SuNHUV7_34730 (plasmid) [Pseudoseohaeicola sp. NH-UV-7]|uniref:ImmA/IrrE family metallo-endopeptidase n=1 Tax=unclassified Sulfitobacter TaxID=196795 RepID=UPI000E0B23E2|nr:ImmA/IrrE family metallo-endopeptidase [Sulfitobacter sp. JL08]AXI54639.1 hypothetical protein C1J05_09155 [Sulfitobacter sp. JL08]